MVWKLVIGYSVIVPRNEEETNMEEENRDKRVENSGRLTMEHGRLTICDHYQEWPGSENGLQQCLDEIEAGGKEKAYQEKKDAKNQEQQEEGKQ
jgi:hypothetical protein